MERSSNLRNYAALCDELRQLRADPDYTQANETGVLKQLDDLWYVMNEAERQRALDFWPALVEGI